jgi:orotate phosphoribosyltransferase
MAGFEHLEELTVGMYDRGLLTVFEEELTLRSGKKSHLYFNIRPLTSFDPNHGLTIEQQRRIRDLSVNAYSHELDQIGPYDHLYGVPQALTALGGLVAQVRGESYLWGRVGTKSYGKHKPVEGNFQEGDRVAVLDDVVTDGATKIENAETLEAIRLGVAGLAIMFDRDEGGAETIQEAGYELRAVTSLGRALPILLEARRVGNREIDLLAKYSDVAAQYRAAG